jgi:small-conductance mechanosensitive channel
MPISLRFRRGRLGLRRWIFLLIASAALSLALAPSAGRCQDPSPEAAAVEQQALDLQNSMAETLRTASAQRDQLKAELEQVRRSARALASELAAYRIQLSTYGSLATLPSVRPETLTKALAEQRQSAQAVKTATEQLAARREALTGQRVQIEQQLTLNQTQFGELKKMATPPPGGAKWLQQLGEVIRVQKETLSLIEKTDALYAEQAISLEAMVKDLAELGVALAAAREQALRTMVFTRGENPLSQLDRKGLTAETEGLRRFGASLSDPKFWRAQTGLGADLGLGRILTFTVLAIGLALVLVRLRAAIRRLRKRTDAGRHPWRAGLLAMVQRAVIPLGLLIFFTVNGGMRPGAGVTVLTGALIGFFWVWLLGDWIRAVFALRLPVAASAWWSHLAVAGRGLVRLSRIYAAIHLFLIWALGSAGMLAALARLGLEAALFIWLLVSWRRWRASTPAPEQPQGSRAWRLQSAVAGSYIAVLAGPVLDLAGYGALALYWYCGWGLTLVAVLWSALMGQSLREIDRPATADAVTAVEPSPRGPLHWVLLRLAWLAWALIFLSFLAMAWGGWKSLESGLGQVLTHPFQIGGLSFRLSGVLIGVLVLFFTHLAVRLWRHLLQGRFLVRSGMTAGARDSITTVSGYLIWAVGILLALNAFGISTTSLTVVFGALGIGLGFGLQNIFNNFISGLILLFERPIQVGDDIEINGIWAKVMQINVRATVVKTYDNAALIIPNSEFISNQVTNWSHKDSNLRRNIDVGVAYGSDTGLVRDTLLEAAANTPAVLKQPRPDVLFTDFGESTLNFRLRAWTTIDSMVNVDTALRFEIDRLFRLRGIEMAFPQRDLHLRSLPNPLPVRVTSDSTARTDGAEAPDETR